MADKTKPRRGAPTAQPAPKHQASAMADKGDHITDAPHPYTAGAEYLAGLAQDAIARHAFKTQRDVALSVGMSPSSFAMCRTTGAHRPPAKAISRLATTLAPPGGDERGIAQNLARLFNYDEKEVRQFRELRVVYVNYAPFSQQDRNTKLWDGFSVQLLQLVADMFDYKLVAIDGGAAHAWSTALTLLQTGDADVASAIVCPTARRRQRINFSEPFPGLRLSVSAVMNKKAVRDIETAFGGDGPTVTLDALHDPNTPWLKTLVPIVVSGEMGEEYAKAFLRGLPLEQIEPLPQLSSGVIIDALEQSERGIAIADSLTCATVADSGSRVLVTASDGSNANALGSYPMCFGLNPRNPELQKLFADAFIALHTEGIRAFAGAYRRYLLPQRQNENDGTLFKMYFNGALVTDPVLHDALSRDETKAGTS